MVDTVEISRVNIRDSLSLDVSIHGIGGTLLDAKGPDHRRAFVEPKHNLWNADTLATDQSIDGQPLVVTGARSHIIDSEVHRIIGLRCVAIDIVQSPRSPLNVNMAIEKPLEELMELRSDRLPKPLTTRIATSATDVARRLPLKNSPYSNVKMNSPALLILQPYDIVKDMGNQ